MLLQCNQSKRVRSKTSLRSSTVLSCPSKTRRFLSRQITHITHNGTAPHTLTLWDFRKEPIQLAINSNTVLGITQTTPNRQNTMDHRLWAVSQWRSKWLGDSPLCLHIQHQSTMQIRRFRKLSIVRIFPWAAVHTKKWKNYPLWKKSFGMLLTITESRNEKMNPIASISLQNHIFVASKSGYPLIKKRK